MNSIRIRNIVIVILALLNAILLALLLGRRAQERAASDRAVRELVSLYAASGISLSPDRIPAQSVFGASDPARDTDAELRFASALLGGETAERALGGGIRRYSGEAGTCLIRTSGAVEAELSRPVSDPDGFCGELFAAFGYTRLSSDGSSVTGVRTLGGGAVFNAPLTLTFEGGQLTGVTGTFLPPVAEAEGSPALDPITALVRFLDYSNASGTVCTEVRAVEQGYLLQSSASAPLRLSPAWRIETDVSYYYVNLMNGEISRG